MMMVHVPPPVAARETARAAVPPERRAQATILRALRALLFRELRPQWPIAVCLMGVGLALVLLPRLSAILTRQDFEPWGRWTNLLLDGSTQALTLFGCPLVGLLVGFLLGRADSPAIWEFMVHRPVQRWVLFAGRLIAAVVLYGMTVGVPVAVLLAYAASSRGGIPFHWRFMLPTVIDGLCGFVFCLAGLQAARSEESLLGARALPVVAAAGCSMLSVMVPEFGEALAWVIAIMVVFGCGVWGAQISNHFRLRMAWMPREARTAIAFMGLSVLFFFGSEMVAMVGDHYLEKESRWAEAQPWPPAKGSISIVRVMPDGTLARRIFTPPAPEIQRQSDFQPESYVTYNQIWPVVENPQVKPDFTQPQPQRRVAWHPIRRALPYHHVDTVALRGFDERFGTSPITPGSTIGWWFASPGIYLGYNAEGLVGSIGADGFAPPGRDPTPFDVRRPDEDMARPGLNGSFIANAHGIFQVDLDARTVAPVHLLPAGEQALFVGAVATAEENWTLLATADRIYFFRGLSVVPQFSMAWAGAAADSFSNPAFDVLRFAALHRWIIKTPRELVYGQASEVETFDICDDGGKPLAHFQFTVPDPPVPARAEDLRLDHHIQMTAAGIYAAFDLPVLMILHRLEAIDSRREATDFSFGVEEEYFSQMALRSAWGRATVAVILTLSGLGMFYLSRRCGAAFQAIWIALALLFGPVMLLVLLATRSLSGLVKCPDCGRMRFLAEPCCRHCGLPFLHPQQNDTEILGQASGGVK